jgi:hypothetical protein
MDEACLIGRKVLPCRGFEGSPLLFMLITCQCVLLVATRSFLRRSCVFFCAQWNEKIFLDTYFWFDKVEIWNIALDSSFSLFFSGNRGVLRVRSSDRNLETSKAPHGVVLFLGDIPEFVTPRSGEKR